MGFDLRWYQAEAVEAVFKYLNTNANGNPCIVLPTGCHAKGHPILMHDGTVKPVECVQVGDKLMGPDSEPRTVQQLCQGVDDMYRIIPTKGDPFVVNADHILSLQCTCEGKRKSKFPCGKAGGEIENISVREYIGKAKYWKHIRKLYRVPVRFRNQKDLPVPPYILGALLGDGYLNGTISITKPDIEMLQEFAMYAVSIGCSFARDSEYTWRITALRGRKNPLRDMLKGLGVFGITSEGKHVPQIYKSASAANRLQILAGLMDSDGSLSKSGYDFISKSPTLSDDVAFLARSLGLAAYVTECEKSCQTGYTGTYYRVSISGHCDIIPCKITRKKAPPRKQVKSVRRTGFKVEYVGKDTYYGVALDGDHLYVDGNFTVHHNSGKTPTMASICQKIVGWGGRVLILAHVKELLQQTADTLQYFLPANMVGVYSAGLNSRDTEHPVICAGIQSVYKKAGELGSFSLVMVDESHLIPTHENGMYRNFLHYAKIVNPKVRFVGLTATPYRLDAGYICGEENILNHICYEVGVRELIVQGYLCPIKTRAGSERPDLSGVHIRGGEYVEHEMAERMDRIVDGACREVVELTKDRKSVLVFSSSVEHGRHVQQKLIDLTGEEVGFVCGETASSERAELIERFKPGGSRLFGHLKYLVNVNVLTTGFDAPNVDAIVMLRATLSPGLYSQICGRGLRIHPDKEDCIVLDYGDNAVRHGPIDDIKVKDKNEGDGEAPAKECPECAAVIHAAYSVCPDCGFEFPPPELKHDTNASSAGILSGEVITEDYDVDRVSYWVHHKKNDPDAPTTMRVEYDTVISGLPGQTFKEWVCFNHTGFARQNAERWWRDRSRLPVPASTEDAVELANQGYLANVERIKVREVSGDKFPKIIGHIIGDLPDVPEEMLPAGVGINDEWFDDDSNVPF